MKTTAYKSRLCTRFMQKGECTYGASCHFAHGYDDLQVPEGQPRPTGSTVPPMVLSSPADQQDLTCTSWAQDRQSPSP